MPDTPELDISQDIVATDFLLVSIDVYTADNEPPVTRRIRIRAKRTSEGVADSPIPEGDDDLRDVHSDLTLRPVAASNIAIALRDGVVVDAAGMGMSTEDNCDVAWDDAWILITAHAPNEGTTSVPISDRLHVADALERAVQAIPDIG